MATDDLSTRSDFYVYALFRENGVPFYVGKGRGDRLAYHGRGFQKNTKSHKTAIIRGMQMRGSEIIRAKLHDGLTEPIAHEYERALIQAIGREPYGPLVNLTDGGEGVTGLAHTLEARASIGNASRGRKKSAIECANIAAGKRGTKASKETLAKLSESHRGKPWSQARRAAQDARKFTARSRSA